MLGRSTVTALHVATIGAFVGVSFRITLALAGRYATHPPGAGIGCGGVDIRHDELCIGKLLARQGVTAQHTFGLVEGGAIEYQKSEEWLFDVE